VSRWNITEALADGGMAPEAALRESVQALSPVMPLDRSK